MTTVRERLAVVRRFRRRLADEPRPFLDALGAVAGRSSAESLTAELIPLADACRFLERRAGELLRPRRLGPRGRPLWLAGSRTGLRREPLGLVLVIGAANYPLLLPGVQVLQALVAGNAVLLKPGRGGAPSARLLAERLIEAGLDGRLVQVLGETPQAATTAISTGVDKVVLTGSAETGRSVLTQLAGRLTPATMELSGCDPVFVRDDADLELVASAVRFGLSFNDSATCIAPRRLYIGRDLAPDLEGRLASVLEDVPAAKLDSPVHDRARALVREALAGGARLVAGGSGEGNAFPPTVLADVPEDAGILSSDIFAPLLSLVRVDGDDEALEKAARCRYALGATVFGESAGALELSERIRAGLVVVNDMIVPSADPRIAFGGRGESGFGVTRGAEGLLEMTAPKVVMERKGRSRPHLRPLVGGEEGLFLGYLRAAHGSGWKARLAALEAVGRSGKEIGKKRKKPRRVSS